MFSNKEVHNVKKKKKSYMGDIKHASEVGSHSITASVGKGGQNAAGDWNSIWENQGILKLKDIKFVLKAMRVVENGECFKLQVTYSEPNLQIPLWMRFREHGGGKQGIRQQNHVTM